MFTSSRRVAAALGALAIVVTPLSSFAPAAADVPSPVVASAFEAPRCEGTTSNNPASGDGAVSNLLSVFGGRLAAYNAGGIVPLYDSSGYNTGAYPPLCGVRYVASVGGPVSEWMFCTDLKSHVCGDTDGNGNLVEGNTPIAPFEKKSTNPKLSADQEKVISYLIQNGHSYDGVGNQAWGGVSTAVANENSNKRMALQSLIWCVSDTPPAGSDLLATCNNSMNAAEQARILALVPGNPTVTLDFDSSGSTLAVGDTAKFKLTTNLFDQPISVTQTGTATAPLTVCEGTATLTGGTLTVPGNGSASARAITLCAKATTAGGTNVAATAKPASTTHIGWNQSPTVVDGKPCQVFAAFYSNQQASVSDSAAATFAAAPNVTPTTPAPTTPAPTTPTAPKPTKPEPIIHSDDESKNSSDDEDAALPDTGGPLSPLMLGLAGSLILAGAGITFAARRTRTPHKH